jgi:hypothetical protein
MGYSERQTTIMKRIILLAVVAVAGSTMGQSLPSDVPSTHWAAPAVSKLYELGILNGYPDGLYRGSRPASRYEMAQAIAKLFTAGKAVTDDLQSQIDRLKSAPSGAAADHQTIADRLTALGIQVDSLTPIGADLAQIKSSFAAMRVQLGSIRSDLDAMKSKLPK